MTSAGCSAAFSTVKLHDASKPSAFAVIYAEVLARSLKTPATLFVVPAILPLVPGGSLYYTMEIAVHNRMEAARSFGQQTLVAALAIAAGISFVVALRELQARKQ